MKELIIYISKVGMNLNNQTVFPNIIYLKTVQKYKNTK